MNWPMLVMLTLLLPMPVAAAAEAPPTSAAPPTTQLNIVRPIALLIGFVLAVVKAVTGIDVIGVACGLDGAQVQHIVDLTGYRVC